MNTTIQDTLREAWFAASVIAGLWFACYLYELGFLARFAVPPLFADIGFSRPLAAALVLGPASAGTAALLLWPARAGSGARQQTGPAYPALWGLLALTFILGVAFLADPTPLVLATDYHVNLNPAGLILALSLAAATALLFAKFRASAQEGNFGAILQSSLLIMLLLAVPIGLGWMGAGYKMQNRRSFFYLVDRSDYVLVRLYDEKAVFVRYDAAAGRFTPDYVVHGLDEPVNLYLTRRPGAR